MSEPLQGEQGILSLALGGSIVGLLVLIVLIFMSSLSWAIIVLKWRQFRYVRQQNLAFQVLFRSGENLASVSNVAQEKCPRSPMALMVASAYAEVETTIRRLRKRQGLEHFATTMMPHLNTRLERTMEQCFNEQYTQIENRLNLLATISSAAPFVGLFGTVLGIIDSFQNIGTSGLTSLAAVAPGISEALIATAAGLLAAIPALIAYNLFRNQARSLGNDLRDFSRELSNRIEWILYEQFVMARK